MSATEAERHELYELAKHHVNDRYAELMLKSLPPEPDRLATKDDVAFAQAATRADMAELRTEMADFRAEIRTDMATMRADLVDRIEAATTRSTRTIVLSLVGSVTAMSIANTLTIALTR